MSIKNIENGVVYGVSKLGYFEETIISAHSVKKQMPHLPIELFIEKKTHDLLVDIVDFNHFFDFINIMEGELHWRTPKFTALTQNRFDNTLYLDGDTYITDSVMELFDLLQRFDIAVSHSPQKIHVLSTEMKVYDYLGHVPISFPEYNGGVLVFKKTEKVNAFFEYWLDTFEKCWNETGYPMDQASFRYCLFHSEMRIATLTPEYNFRALGPSTVRGKVKIIHAHGHLPKIAQLVNVKQETQRNWNPPQNLLFGFQPEDLKESTEEQKEIILNKIRNSVSRLIT